MKRCQVTTILPAPAQTIWEAVKRPATLFHVTRGMLGFSGKQNFPARWQIGQSLQTRLWFFHLLPAPFVHKMQVAEVDEARRLIRSHETSPVYTWDHTIRVDEQNDTTRYTDSIDIQAGLFTWLIWLYANIFYRYRQWRWYKLAWSL
jgi:ligand-binding SRPBCC domain-containing protein